MASSSEASPPATTSIRAPYRDDPEEVESTALLIGEEGIANRSQAATDEEQGTTASQSLQDGATPDTPRRQFTYIRFHRATLILAVIILVDLIGFLVFSTVGQDIGFHFPGHFEEPCGKALIWALITVAWAGTALHRHRKKQPPLSLALGTVFHGILGFFIFGTAAESSYVLDLYPSSTCWGYGDGYDDRCEILFRVFWCVCLVYVVVLYVLSLLQWILFTACLTATYRRQLGVNGSEHGFTLPGGQISIEFSIRFLRQDAPPPASIRGVSPLSPAPPSTSASAQAPAPAPVAGPLIATD